MDFFQDSQYYSDMGGAVGLWVGASLITLVEFFEYGLDVIVLACLRCCKRKTSLKRNSTTPVQDLPKNNGIESPPKDYSQYGSY